MIEQFSNKLTKAITDAIDKFNSSIPGIQSVMLDDVTNLVKQLETDSHGSIKNSVNNLRIVSKINNRLENIILNDDYIKNVTEFALAFEQVSQINSKYFSAIESEFKTTPLLKEIQKQSIDFTVESLTENGLSANVTSGVKDILLRNITSGGSFSSLLDQFKNYLTTNNNGDGALQRYARQITTDSLNQYNRTYLQVVASDLGMDWFMYTGSNIKTTREFCIHMTKKLYYHKSELPMILKGDIDGHQCAMNPKTKLWYGAIEGTNADNFQTNAGGYGCGHVPVPVLATVVPKGIRDAIVL